MARPPKSPHLDPRDPRRKLGWAMRVARLASRWTGKQVAEAFGCDPSHISRVEHGQTRPSRELVRFYDETFEQSGQLLSLFEPVIHSREQDRQRAGGRRIVERLALDGDASEFISDTVPHGSLMAPGQRFIKTWTIRNSGVVPWVDRCLERLGPLAGPGLITSERHYPIPDTAPGGTVTIQALLTAPTYDCSSLAYFKMVDVKRQFCFPDNYPFGLDVSVLVRGQRPDEPPMIDPNIVTEL